MSVWRRGDFEASSLIEDQSCLRSLGRVMLVSIIFPEKHAIDSLQVFTLLRRNRDIGLHRVHYGLQIFLNIVWLLDFL